MKRRLHRLERAVVLGSMGLVLSMALCGLAGARLNLSASLPRGLYWVVDEPVTRDAHVMFCPPAEGAFAEAMQRGYLRAGRCPGGYRPLLKRVSGVAGDLVSLTSKGVFVNGRHLPLSATLRADRAGRRMPHPEHPGYLLRPSQLWVMSVTHAQSFDSRYFGPIESSWVTEVVRPVVTWGYGGTISGLSLAQNSH